ncbi:uncharacterized protein LOC124927127 [Impatiens glandulifera]|uniref:uncharacterized protein LOC124927127 n=1 Tax=Impatiens glandulifera TaxID=253017 RepID=UPI001FB05AD4|nr:uncharacterized protein LOC124927127 [Impatiens glandulifera]
MMPTATGKSNRGRGTEEEKSNRGKGKFSQKRASSFHGASSANMAAGAGDQMIRPRTVPDLLSGIRDHQKKGAASNDQLRLLPKLTKLLLHVTIQGSLGPVQVLIPPESTVGDLIAATVRQYVKEGRRPFLTSLDASAFDLHYSQFSLESLDRDEKLIALGSRNFFLCMKRSAASSVEDGGSSAAAAAVVSSSRCSEEAGKPAKNNIPPWLKFMDFLIYHKGV